MRPNAGASLASDGPCGWNFSAAEIEVARILATIVVKRAERARLAEGVEES